MKNIVRNAVRCFIIKEDQVVCIKYLKGRIGFYDIPGGKIEDNERPEETVYRECLEETGLKVINPQYKGIMYVNYPDRSFVFKTFLATDYIGEIKNFEENTSQWIKIKRLLQEKNRFSNTLILKDEYIKYLLDKDKTFELHIKCDKEDNILEINFKYI